jgi:hypothetical protein
MKAIRSGWRCSLANDAPTWAAKCTAALSIQQAAQCVKPATSAGEPNCLSSVALSAVLACHPMTAFSKGCFCAEQQLWSMLQAEDHRPQNVLSLWGCSWHMVWEVLGHQDGGEHSRGGCTWNGRQWQ